MSMMFLVLLLASLLVSVSATKETALDAAFASFTDFLREKEDPVPGAALRAADENKDGKVSKEEFKKISEDILGVFLEMADKNKDRSLSEQEVLEWGSTLKGFLSAIKIAFKGADTNRDGFLSTADMISDKNRDGLISEEEMIPHPRRAALDTNNDGRISLHEYQESESRKLPEFLVKAIKLLDKNVDGQISLDDINNFVKAFWSITDKDGNGYLDIDEGLVMLKRHNLTDEHVAALKKITTKAQDATKMIIREYVKKIDANGDKQIDRNELIAVLNKPYIYNELANVRLSFPASAYFMGPEGFTGSDMTQFSDVLDNILDDPNFSKFSSSGKSTAMFFMVLMSAIVAFML